MPATTGRANLSPRGNVMTTRAEKLASRIEQGANALAEFAERLSDAQWRTKLPGDGRTVGVVVHHVASVYPIELDLAKTVASGKPIVGITYEGAIREMNAKHAMEHATAPRKETVELLRRNCAAAAAATRAFTDAELDRAAAVSLNADAPLTAQFVIEDHAVRHSYHHMARIRAAVS
ncbi:MAG TPA: DinB family protein [Gemmatimonadaceae bacterium]